MVKFIYVRTPVFKEAYKNTYLIKAVDSADYRDEFHGKKCNEKVNTPGEFEEFCKVANLWSVTLVLFEQNELDYFTSVLSECEIEMFEPHRYKADIDLAPFEKLKKVQKIYLFEFTKLDKLWDTTKNTNLKMLHVLNCNSLHDFSELKYSGIETLKLFGCNGLSSFTSKLHVDDFSFVLTMPNLKSLHIEIVKDKPAEYYLNILAQMKNLEEFMCPESFFTFEQFAWLAAKLPNTKGLEASLYCKELKTYSIIGNRKPRFLKDKQRVEKYEKQYELLKVKFKDQTEPPQ